MLRVYNGDCWGLSTCLRFPFCFPFCFVLFLVSYRFDAPFLILFLFNFCLGNKYYIWGAEWEKNHLLRYFRVLKFHDVRIIIVFAFPKLCWDTSAVTRGWYSTTTKLKLSYYSWPILWGSYTLSFKAISNLPSEVSKLCACRFRMFRI